MKTPREILSERHQSAVPKLDALRRRVLAEHVSARAEEGVSQPTFFEKLWQELILPYRRIWIGLAAVWMVILGAVFITASDVPQTTLAKTSPPTPEVLTALKEQRQMMAQLLGPIALPPVRAGAPAPRSERREESYAV